MGKRCFRVNVARDSALAEHAFRAMSYKGTDGGIVWKAAAWVNTGAITEWHFADAYNGVRIIKPANPVAYFRAILNDKLGEARLTALLRRTSLPRGLVPGPPATLVERERGRRGPDENSRMVEPERIGTILQKTLTMRRLAHAGSEGATVEIRSLGMEAS